MSWRAELISSKEEALDFIERNLALPGMPPFQVDDIEDGNPYGFAPLAHPIDEQGSGHHFENMDEDEDEEVPTILYFDALRRDNRECYVDGFLVGDAFKGRGFGLIGVKALLALAYHYSATHITLPLVNRDGPSFWPTLGALPRKAPTDLPTHISDALQSEKTDIGVADEKKLLAIAEIAKTNAYLGWRVLGVSSVLRSVKHTILGRTCLNEDLILIPGEPSTREIIPLSLENPKIFRVYDAEVIGDGIAIGAPVSWDFIAQEA